MALSLRIQQPHLSLFIIYPIILSSESSYNLQVFYFVAEVRTSTALTGSREASQIPAAWHRISRRRPLPSPGNRVRRFVPMPEHKKGPCDPKTSDRKTGALKNCKFSISSPPGVWRASPS